MTYAVSFFLMLAGMILLLWTVAAAVRYKRGHAHRADWTLMTTEQHRPITFSSFEHRPRETERFQSLRSDGTTWIEPERDSGHVRFAPDMGGFTDVPLRLSDSNNNTVYIRQRLWVN